jgi:hypothetical protein
MGSTLSIGFEGRVPAKLINMTNININQNNVNVNFVFVFESVLIPHIPRDEARGRGLPH